MSSEAERGWRRWLALPRQTAGIHEHLPSYHEALTQCCFNVVPTSKTAASIRTASFLLGCGHSWSANSSHWHNVSLIVAHSLQHWAGIGPSLAYQYIGLNKINAHPMLAHCRPIVYDHGSAVKQHWLKVSFLQGTPATQYPNTMLVQCWKRVIDDGTTFNQHWVSASQKEAVTSAERKYILDLQVSKYSLLAALWQEEMGRQLKSSKCLVYQGADIAFWHYTDRTDSNGS